MTEVYFIRHGESLGNKNKEFLGHLDIDLSSTGYKQAEITAKYLKQFKIDAIYSSDLKRAYHTAEKIAEICKIKVKKRENLREIFAGKWQGKKFDDIKKQFPNDYNIWLNDIGNAKCTDGETVTEMHKRILREVKKIININTNKRVVIVTHATPIRALICEWENKKFSEMKNIGWVPNASTTLVRIDDGNVKFVKIGYNEYLGEFGTMFGANV